MKYLIGIFLISNFHLHVSNIFHFSIFFLSLSLSPIRTLDVGNSNMTFGGLRTTEAILVHPSQIRTHDFVGCIRNFHVNGILLRPSMALAAYNIFDRQAY